MTAVPLLLGIDLGTSSLKCGLFDLSGNCASALRVAYPTGELPGGAEQDCRDWFAALADAVRQLAREVDSGRIVALALGGHAPSPVPLDADLQPVAPVMPWMDDRSASQRERLLAILRRPLESGPERYTLQVAARLVWLRETSPRQFAAARSILHSADYLVARLTGERIASTGLAPAVWTAADLPSELLADRQCRPGEIVGPTLAEAAGQLGLPAGVPVVAGGIDSLLASIGSGIHQPGDACLNLGSAGIVALLTRGGPTGRFQWNGCQLVSRPIRPGGRSLNWVQQLTGSTGSLADLLVEAARLPPGQCDDPALGQLVRTGRSPDGLIRRRLAELAGWHSPAELVRLLLDAIFLAQRTVLDEIETQGQPARRIRSVGGLSAVAPLAQLQANVLGRLIEVPLVTDSGALGAAMLAAIALGHFTPADAASRMVRSNRTCHPDPQSAPCYDVMLRKIHADGPGGNGRADWQAKGAQPPSPAHEAC